MSIKRLKEFIDHKNIAELILDEKDGQDTLDLLAKQVVEDHESDLDSMSEWVELVEKGKELAKQEHAASSEPWPGASNYKDPAIMDASNAIGNRATTELLRSTDLVKTTVIGKDDNGAKREKADRVGIFMNWDLDHKMKYWRQNQSKLFYEVPAVGQAFKKTYFDPIKGVNQSEVIHYPDFSVNQATTHIDEARSFTQIMAISHQEALSCERAGIWISPHDESLEDKEEDADAGSNEDAEVIDAIDNESPYLEQYCWYDLDHDGYAEPYIVTVQKNTSKVVRIIARFELSGITVQDGEVFRQLEEADHEEPIEVIPEVIPDLSEEDRAILEEMKPKAKKKKQAPEKTIICIEPISLITSYAFLNSNDGTFLGLGYYHILVAFVRAINKTANQLLNAGVLANQQGGFIAKGFRQKLGNTAVKPGAYIQTNLTAMELQQGIREFQFKEPSPTLLALVDRIDAKVQKAVATIDFAGMLAPNAPATTTLALVQESLVPISAIFQRYHWSMTEEYQKLFKLNAKFLDPKEYKKVIDSEQADFQADFDLQSMDVAPTSNPEASSKMQRINQAEAVMSKAEIIGLTGGSLRPVFNLYLDAIGLPELVDQIYPDPAKMTPEQQQQLQAQQEEQQAQKMLRGVQVDQSERALVVQEQKAESERAKMAKELEVKDSEIVLNREKAETEQTKNRINTYTAQIGAVNSAIDNLEKEERMTNAREAIRNEATRINPEPPGIL